VTSATAQARPEPATGFSKARRAFRNWRRSRPFWGGLLVILAGLPILYFPYANLNIGTLSLHLATSAGAASLLIGLLMIALGISAWFQPHIRVFAGIAALVLALVSIPMSNLGGFGMGLLLGLLGGGLLCSWAPLKQPRTAELVDDGSAAAESDAQSESDGEEEWDESPVPGFEKPQPDAPQADAEGEPTVVRPRAGEQSEAAAHGWSEEEQRHGE